jgi:hypothetical protein
MVKSQTACRGIQYVKMVTKTKILYAVTVASIKYVNRLTQGYVQMRMYSMRMLTCANHRLSSYIRIEAQATCNRKFNVSYKKSSPSAFNFTFR